MLPGSVLPYWLKIRTMVHDGIYAQLRPEPCKRHYQDYWQPLHDKNLPLINRVTQGFYPSGVVKTL
ncbi:hypothetical protein KCP76_20950 [Salmonella enterica subsp. enterica serovar Weltevreden]|nr:hypothetical protein KCP76_20950 [Salmonella enterica subsp. enterica serovar Weltevreden]